MAGKLRIWNQEASKDLYRDMVLFVSEIQFSIHSVLRPANKLTLLYC